MDNKCFGKRLAHAVGYGLGACSTNCRRRGSGDVATRERVLEQARRIVAIRGAEVTVREICQTAGANVAAISYHFGGKEGLLAEVLNQHLKDLLTMYPMDGGVLPTASVEERFSGFVFGFLCRILLPTGRGDDVLLGQMLSDAFVRPFPAFAPYAERHKNAVREFLGPVIGELSGRPGVLSQEILMLLVRSVVAQILFYNQNRDKFIALRGDRCFSPEDIRCEAAYVVRFCLGGIARVLESCTCEQ